MDDRMRVSDADRDRVSGRLREHFAEGRLTHDELDERISAALNAKTFGDLRPLTADLPEPVQPRPTAAGQPGWSGPPAGYRRRGPRFLPVLLLVLIVGVLMHGAGLVIFGVAKLFLVALLVVCLAGFFASRRIGGRSHRGRQRRRRHWD